MEALVKLMAEEAIKILVDHPSLFRAAAAVIRRAALLLMWY